MSDDDDVCRLQFYNKRHFNGAIAQDKIDPKSQAT